MTVMAERIWPAPKSPWVMRMTWSELLFAHWEIEPRLIEPLLPPGLTLDRWDGKAWIGVVPFLMSKVAPRCCPPLPRLNRFLELNVRTYVTYRDKPGVWFFSLDAENPVAVRVARSTFYLPYMDSTMALRKDESGMISYRSDRTHRGAPAARFEAIYQSTGEPIDARPGTLEHWLTARYCLYSANRRNVLFRGEIDHRPWVLEKATCTVRQNTMGLPYGFDLASAPHLLFAQPLTVYAWPLIRC